MASSSSAADVSITREQLTKYFHLPITDVAKELGICATMLKKICRKNGIPRWPHRKIKSLNKMIESLEASLTNDGSEAGECIRQEIIILKNKKSLIMRNPSILVQGNSNKRSSEIGSEDGAQPSSKKQRSDALQAPVTTFTNPKQSLPSTSPNAFSINQLLTPPTTYSSPLTSAGGIDEKDYRAYAHHAHAYPHHMVSPFPDPSRVDPKGHMDGRSFASPLTSYLPEDDGRHMESPLLHSADSYYFHKAALAYQYYPRQMLPPSYPPPPPHGLSGRSPYYHPYGGHDARPVHLLTQGEDLAAAAELQEQHAHHQQQVQQQQAQVHQAHQQAQQAQAQAQAQQTQQTNQQTTQTQSQQQPQVQQSTPSPQVPTQKQQPIQQQQQQQQRMQSSPQQQQQQQNNQTQSSASISEALPKMNIPTSDIYKFRNQPSSPPPSSSSSSSSIPSFAQGVELPYFYHQYSAQQQQQQQQQQRLHPQ